MWKILREVKVSHFWHVVKLKHEVAEIEHVKIKILQNSTFPKVEQTIFAHSAASHYSKPVKTELQL